MNRFEGKRVLVTRAPDQAREMMAALREVIRAALDHIQNGECLHATHGLGVYQIFD